MSDISKFFVEFVYDYKMQKSKREVFVFFFREFRNIIMNACKREDLKLLKDELTKSLNWSHFGGMLR